MKKAKEATTQYQTVPKATATVTISAELLEQLRQAADWKGITLEEAAQEATRDE
jgi:hypothetical protein